MNFESRDISEAEYNKLLKDLENLEYEKKRSEAITSIIQLLESELSFEMIAEEIVRIIGEFLGVSNVTICKWNTEQTKVQPTVEWLPKGGTPYFAKVDEELLTEYIIKMKGTLVCDENNQSEVTPLLVKRGIYAMIAEPVVLNGNQVMYILVADSDRNRSWRSNTIQFIVDVCKILQDILEKNISKNSLVSSYNAIKEILDNIGNGLFVIDKTTKKILFANNTMKMMAKDDMEGELCSKYGFCGMRHKCENCDILKESSAYFETYANDRQAWYDVKFNDILWVDGRTVAICNVLNITEKKKIEKRIEFQANNDFLTGLYNRMRCEFDIDKRIRNAEANGLKGYILFLDLDNFKHLNDGLGHQYGDMLLKIISLGLQQIKGIEDSCYRVGGDEFVIIVENEQIDRADEILRDVKELFNKPWELNGTEYYCTMSMGVVSYPEDGKSVQELIKKADIAMYDAKKSGKNRIVFYNAKNESSSIKRLDLENNMRSAIALGGNEFEVYIQPIIDLEKEECIGGEALIRWNSNNLGFIAPNDFIPLAEHLGLIVCIGEMFLRRACEICKNWSDKGVDKTIHINLSIVQLVQNNIVEVINKAISDSGVNPANIILEVTESLAINDMNNMKKVIKEIKELGVEIALDDFGTGYSSLNYIKQMDFDIIKVDKIFVDDIVSDDYAQTFVRLITELSEKLGVKVCIEGVETREQLETLKAMKVSLIQGYLYGKPIPYREFERVFLGINQYEEHIDLTTN